SRPTVAARAVKRRPALWVGVGSLATIGIVLAIQRGTPSVARAIDTRVASSPAPQPAKDAERAGVPALDRTRTKACSDSSADWEPTPNERELRRARSRGLGLITIENGSAADAVVWLVDADGAVARKIFVSRGQTAVLKGIAD